MTHKEYLIHYDKQHFSQLEEQLKQYAPTYFEHIPYCAVRVEGKREASLLEALAAIPGITYRQALTRKTQDDRY